MKFWAVLLTMLALAKCSTGLKAETNSPAGTNAPARPAAPVFAVRGYEIEGNTVLSTPQLEGVLTNYVGPALDLNRLRQGLGDLQLLYRNFGFATVALSLPQQQLTNGVVKVTVTEGRLADINIVGNQFYSSNNIRRALPSLTTNILLNTKWFQPELDQANASQDRQIYPVVSPGPYSGTTALTLKVKDRMPLHGHLELNNTSTPGTPPLRIDSSIQYDNLWQLDHQVGLQYNFSPQQMKSENQLPEFWNEPLVASYSGFYRLPIGIGRSLRENYDELPVDFGYDQVTHRFNLPPPTGRSELTVYAYGSDAENPVVYGPLTVITNTPLADISSQFAERDITESDSIGGNFTYPLREFGGIRSSLSLGFGYKYYRLDKFSTNLTYFDLYALDPAGNRVLVRQDTIPFGSSGWISVGYLPLTLGWSASEQDKWGSTTFSFSQNIFLSGLASSKKYFEILAGSTQAGGNYTTINPSLVRDQKLWDDWSLLFRANGQWASAPLISNEQYELGGITGVRGYENGATYGDSGWRVMTDLRTPPFWIGELPLNNEHSIPVHLRGSIFFDYGERYLIDPTPLSLPTERQMGAGFSAYATAGQHFDARLTLAWALKSTPLTAAGSASTYFTVGFQF